MIVRVVIRLIEGALIQRFVHATRHEPVVVDAGQGMIAFDVPYSRVEAVLNRLARTGVAEFLAHVTQRPESQIADPGEEG
jgi:hypothetical protein